jgi:TRAP-type C4-dicarboxylate transport system permease small subunit
MEKVGKIVTIILWVLLIVSAVLIVSMMVNISENEADPTMGGWINSNLVWSYVLLAIGAGIAILAGLFHMTTDIKAAKKGLISLVFLAAVAVVSYLLASDTIPQFAGVQKFINDGTLTTQVAKMVDAGLYATYILLALAILSILFSSVNRLFK